MASFFGMDHREIQRKLNEEEFAKSYEEARYRLYENFLTGWYELELDKFDSLCTGALDKFDGLYEEARDRYYAVHR